MSEQNRSLIAKCIAVDCGKTVEFKAKDRSGYNVDFTLTKDEYLAARSVLTNGVLVTDLRNVITPQDIVNYLYEANPESQNVMVDVEVDRGIRNKLKSYNQSIIAIGGFATIIMAMVIFYLAVVKDPTAVSNVVDTVASGASVMP